MEKFRAYIAAYLVLVCDDKILFSRRFNTGYQDGSFSLVAGHLEGGETAMQCIARESEEEVGIILVEKSMEVVHVMHRLSTDREYIDIYVRATRWSGDLSNKEPHKCDNLNWYRIDDLPHNIVPEVRYALENIDKNIHYSEIGWK